MRAVTLNEADTRAIVEERLRDARWPVEDPMRVNREMRIHYAGPHVISDERSEYDARGSHGRADFVLRDSEGKPLAVIEAKAAAIQPYVAKQQALPYARQIGAPFIFLTNGELIYFWDYT